METRFLLRLPLRALKPTPLLIRHHHTSTKPSQANPIGDYYASLLESPASKPPTPISSSGPSSNCSDSDTGPAILFSSRLSSPLERRSEIQKKSTLIAGIWVPPRPDEPDNCCMSGCVNCVWDRYGEELEEWAGKRREADAKVKMEGGFEREKRRRRGPMVGEGGKGVSVDTSMDDDGGGSESNWGLEGVVESEEELFRGVPVGIREFMKQEKRLKEKHAKQGTSGG